MEFPEAEAFVAGLTPAAREGLLQVLTSSSVVRAHTIRRFLEQGNQPMAELLTLLEERESARQALIEELRSP
jgi:hypothetical protein